jgi:hypothetical protein
MMKMEGWMDGWMEGWMAGKTWGGFHKAIYTLGFKFALCDQLFSLI